MAAIKSGYDAGYTLGKKLTKVPGILKAMQPILTANYSAIKSNCAQQGKTEETEQFKIKIAYLIDKKPRNPFVGWRRVKSGSSSVIVDVPGARTTYQYDFFFVKEPEEIQAPMAGGNTGLGYEVVDSDNELNPTESAVHSAEAAMGFDKRDGRKSKKNRRKTKVRLSSRSISASMHSMSISKKDTNEDEYTLESVYSSVSSSASESDELNSVATTSTQRAIETNNRNRLARLDGLVIGEEGGVPTAIVSTASNRSSKVRRRQNRGNSGQHLKRYDPRIDDNDDDDSDDSSFLSAKSSSTGYTKSRSRNRR